jgi:hypothetical protein
MTDRCVQGVSVVHSDLCGTPLSLIPIVMPIDCTQIPIPRCFDASGASFLKQALVNLEPEPGFSGSDIRRFMAFLKIVRFLACNSEATIERPDLWVQAYTQTFPRYGQNFAETYIKLLGENK